MSKLFKRTKILATIGPSVMDEQKITDIIFAGVNGARLNFSHGTYEEHEKCISWIRAAAKKKGRPVAIVQDLQGPKIRLGTLKDNHFDVHAGDELILDSSVETHDGSNILPIGYNLAKKVKIDEQISLFDGKIRAKITEIISDTAIKILVENSGFLMSKKGINLPDTDLGGDIFTSKDLDDIRFGAAHDIDYVAMSFIQDARDVEKLREILTENHSDAKIIAKIETKKAISSLKNLEEIVLAADGIMVARGDMAVEAGNEVVPIVERNLISLCRKHAKFCIVATQMLLSMTENTTPTRAEVNDVATAVIEGADVVMLSDETANGKYPVETVAEMKKIILYTQNHSNIIDQNASVVSENENYDAISQAASHLAMSLDADVLVAQTASGATSRAMAAVRPHLPIISVTDNPRVANQISLLYGSIAFVRPYSDQYGTDLVSELKNSGYLKLRENSNSILAVIVSGEKNQIAGTDTIHLEKI